MSDEQPALLVSTIIIVPALQQYLMYICTRIFITYPWYLAYDTIIVPELLYTSGDALVDLVYRYDTILVPVASCRLFGYIGPGGIA